MNCPSGQGKPCPHGEAGCAMGCRFDTDDLDSARALATEQFWRADLPVTMFPGPREWLVDMFLGFVDLCKWPVVAGLGYWLWRWLS